MVLNRRSIIPGLLTAAAVPTAAYAFRLAPGKGAAEALSERSCEAAPLHADLRQAALDRLAEGGVRVEDLMKLSHCPSCGCGTLADMPEDFLKSLAG